MSQSPTFRIVLPADGGDKIALVRFPADQEWIERQRHRILLLKDLGRGNTRIDPQPAPEADVALYQAIRLDGSADLDQDEIEVVIAHLEEAQVLSCDRDSSGFTVVLRTPFGEKRYDLRVPSFKDLMAFRRSRASTQSLPFNTTRIKVNIAAGAHLFDQVAREQQEVPVIWKAKVADAVNSVIEGMVGGSDPADF